MGFVQLASLEMRISKFCLNCSVPGPSLCKNKLIGSGGEEDWLFPHVTVRAENNKQPRFQAI